MGGGFVNVVKYTLCDIKTIAKRRLSMRPFMADFLWFIGAYAYFSCISPFSCDSRPFNARRRMCSRFN